MGTKCTRKIADLNQVTTKFKGNGVTLASYAPAIARCVYVTRPRNYPSKRICCEKKSYAAIQHIILNIYTLGYP